MASTTPIPETLVLASRPQPRTCVLTLNRPAKKNALSQALIDSFLEALTRAAADPEVAVIVVTGAGATFSAGADLKEIAALDAEGARRVRYLESLCNTVASIRTPLIAAVESLALGGGFELALMCDMIVASSSALFGFPEVKVGLLPGAGGTQRLTSTVGKYRAMGMILSGEPMSATQAEQLGLITKLCQPGMALQDALALAALVGGKSRSATMLAKEAIQRAENLCLDLEFERSLYYSAFGTADKQEGVSAFIEKRTPAWGGSAEKAEKAEGSQRGRDGQDGGTGS